MRQIVYSDIVKTKYSIYEGLNKLQQKNAAKKFCIDKYIELKNKKESKCLLEDVPKKKYEIYKLIADDEKLLMIDTNYFQESREKEVYYNKKIASKIYENMINLEENVLCSFPDVMELYQDDIMQIQDEIEKLKLEDDLKFNEDMKEYQMVNNSDIVKALKDEIDVLRIENIKLRKKVGKANEIIISLSKRLEIALGRVQDLQNSKMTLGDKIREMLEKIV